MKNKAILLIALSCLLFVHVNAQKKDKTAATSQVSPAAEPELNIYNSAIQFGDYEAAKNAIYALMEKHPENNSYLDTLTRLYFSLGANRQTILAGTACLKKDTSDDTILEMVAIADNSMKRNEEALAMYQRLQSRTKSTYFGYQVALNQYELNHLEACAEAINAILKDTAINSRNINITMEKNRNQTVPLKAAAYNLLGVSQLDLKQDDKAKVNFASALKLDPDFELAQQNMAFVSKPKEGEGVPPSKLK